MPAINLPSSINQASWSKKAGDHDKSSEIGNSLKDLARMHVGLGDLSVLEGKLDKPEDVEAAKAKLDALAKKQVPDICAAAKKLVSAANAKNKELAKNSAAKDAASQAATIAKEADAYAVQLEKAVANARTNIDKRAAELAAAAKKNANQKGDKDEDEALPAKVLFGKAADFLKKQVRKHVPVPGKIAGYRFMAVWTKAESAAIFVGRPGASFGEAHKKKAAEHFKLPKPPNTFTIGEVVWNEELKKYVFACRGAIPPKKKLNKWLKDFGVRPADALVKKFVKNKQTGEEEEVEAAEAEGEGTEDTAAAETAPTAAPEAEAKKDANQNTDDVKAFEAEAKKRLDTIKSKLPSLDKKTLDEVKNLGRVVQDKGKNAATLNEAKSALNRIMSLAGGGGGNGQVPPEAPPQQPTGAATAASPALAQAQSAWSTDVSNFRKGVNDLLKTLDEAYSGEPEQQAAVESAKKALDAAAGKVGDQLNTMLRAMMQANAQQRTQLVPRVRAELQNVRAALTSDKILAALDGNELSPGLSVVGPMRQRLQVIEAALG